MTESDNVHSPHSSSPFRRMGQPALIVAAVLYGLFFIPWLVLGGMLLLSYSPSDVPFVYLTTCAYPLISIGGVAAGFVLYRQNRFQAAFAVLFIPLLSICLFLVSFASIWP